MLDNFKKLLRLTWMRFSIWIILIFTFLTIISQVNLINNIKYDYDSFIEANNTIRRDLSLDEYPKDYKIDDKFLIENDKVANEYKNKYKLKRYYELDKMSLGQRDDYNQYIYNKNLEKKDMSLNIVDDIYRKTTGGKIGVNDYIKIIIIPVIIFIIIFSISITSLEKSLNFYEFTKMLPWKNKDELFMKSFLSFLFGCLIFIINILIMLVELKSSGFSSAFTLKSDYITIFRYLLIFLATSVLSTSLGYIAGNFLGHLGLLLIVFLGITLIVGNIELLVSLFSESTRGIIFDHYDKFIQSSNDFIKSLVSLTNFNQASLGSILALFIISFLASVIAIKTNKNKYSEKAGYMIINPIIAKFCKVLASITLANSISSLVSGVFTENLGLINIIIFGLSLLISFKFFDILFNIELKF